MHRRVQTLALGIICCAVIGIISLVSVGSYHTDPTYLLWKYHFRTYQPEVALRYFNIDTGFRSSLIGKSKTEIQRWFPDLRPISKSDPYLPYCGNDVWQPEFVWISSTRWGILFENGKAKYINLYKG